MNLVGDERPYHIRGRSATLQPAAPSSGESSSLPLDTQLYLSVACGGASWTSPSAAAAAVGGGVVAVDAGATATTEPSPPRAPLLSWSQEEDAIVLPMMHPSMAVTVTLLAPGNAKAGVGRDGGGGSRILSFPFAGRRRSWNAARTAVAPTLKRGAEATVSCDPWSRRTLDYRCRYPRRRPLLPPLLSSSPSSSSSSLSSNNPPRRSLGKLKAIAYLPNPRFMNIALRDMPGPSQQQQQQQQKLDDAVLLLDNDDDDNNEAVGSAMKVLRGPHPRRGPAVGRGARGRLPPTPQRIVDVVAGERGGGSAAPQSLPERSSVAGEAAGSGGSGGGSRRRRRRLVLDTARARTVTTVPAPTLSDSCVRSWRSSAAAAAAAAAAARMIVP